MKTPLNRVLTISIISLLLALGGAFSASCSKADATAKKGKSKKAAKEEPENETAETDEHAQPEEEPNKTETSDRDANKAADPHELKKGDKEPGKGGEKKKGEKDEKLQAKNAKSAADEIWGRLSAGNKRFMSGRQTTINYAAARKTLTREQHPEVVVLGCADSRVPPEFVFDKNLGELFVVRDAGNVPDKVSLGSIEYAVKNLHAKALLILGHDSCDAVAAAVSGEEMATVNLSAVVDNIAPAFEGSKTCVIGQPSNQSCVELNVKHSSDDVIARSPILKKAVKDGELAVIRAVYKMETGEVVRLD